MTHQFTHPDNAEPGHEWVRADKLVRGLAAKHLSGAEWAVQAPSRGVDYFPRRNGGRKLYGQAKSS